MIASNASLLTIGQAAPDFRLLDQQGRSLGIADGMGAKGVILLFFSSFWLPGDMALLQDFGQAYPRLKEAGLGVMAISGINWETLYHLSQKLESPFPLLFDPCCRLSKAYQTMAIPKFVTGRAVYGLTAEGRVAFAAKRATPNAALSVFGLSQ